MLHLSYTLIDLHSQNAVKPNKRADNCVVRQIKHKIDKTVIFHVGCHESWSAASGHIVSVKFNVDIKKYQKEKPLTTNVQVSCSCLTGDTKIPLLDGRTLTLEEIHNEYGYEKPFWVYSTDENGDFKAGEARSLGITRHTNELYKITLDNGEEIKATGNHPFMKRDGSYINAEFLKEGDSLMPLYRTSGNIHSKYSVRRYEKIKLNSSGKQVFTFREVAKQVVDGHNTISEDVKVVHHIDFNPDNNSPENLKWMGNNEHYTYHSSLGNGKSFKRMWDNNREKMMSHVRKNGIKTHSLYPEQSKACFEKGIKWMKLDGNASKLGKLSWSILSNERRNERSLSIKKHRRSPESIKDSAFKANKNYSGGTPQFSHNKRINADEDIKLAQKIGKIMKKCYIMDVEQKLIITEQSFNNFYIHGFPHWDNVFVDFSQVIKWWNVNKKRCVLKYKQLFPDEIKQLILEIKSNPIDKSKCRMQGCANKKRSYLKDYCSLECKKNHKELRTHNHKVVSVEKIEVNNVPVYDISVNKWENFLLDAGIVVHNCPAFLFWGSEYAATQLDYGLDTNENRPPVVRDPNNNNLICKHIAKVRKQLRNYTFKQLLNDKNKIPIRGVPILSSYIDLDTTDEDNLVDKLVEAGISIK